MTCVINDWCERMAAQESTVVKLRLDLSFTTIVSNNVLVCFQVVYWSFKYQPRVSFKNQYLISVKSPEFFISL